MIARFLRVLVAITPRIMGRRLMRDLEPFTPQIHPLKASITPVIITAYPRQYPQTTMHRGKGVVINSTGFVQGSIYTARHVLEDYDLIYRMDSSIELTRLIDLGGDLGLAYYSGIINTGARLSIPVLESGQVLMAKYRNMTRSRLTGAIINMSGTNFIINLVVEPGDSGSPVVLPNSTIGIVSQSHNGDQAIVKVVR